MRLDSILRRDSANRIDILNYIGGKIKDNQILKFIDKILAKKGKAKTLLTQINPNVITHNQREVPEDDFDYLNDD